MPASKEQIADTFERHVQRFGYAKATVEDVAAELGISKKTVYEHFGSKRDIYAYITDRIAREFRGQMKGLMAQAPDWGSKFEAVMRFVTAGARQHVEETSKSDWQQEYEVAADAFLKAIGDVMKEIVEGGLAAGEFHFPDAVLAQRLIGAMMLDYTHMVREDPGIDFDDAVVKAMRRFLG